MLTPHDLAVLRAALIYLEEELGPHGVEAMRPYFADPLPEGWTANDIPRLRVFLSTCKLRYLACDRTTTRVLHAEVASSPEEIGHITEIHNGVIATLLV